MITAYEIVGNTIHTRTAEDDAEQGKEETETYAVIRVDGSLCCIKMCDKGWALYRFDTPIHIFGTYDAKIVVAMMNLLFTTS